MIFYNDQLFERNCVYSVAFTQDNLSAYVNDGEGNIKKITWKANATTEDEFDLTQESKKLGGDLSYQICLTKDDKHILAGGSKKLSVFDTRNFKLTKEIKMSFYVVGIKLVNEGKSAIVAEMNGHLTVIDLETLEITESFKQPFGAELNQIYLV